MRKLIVASSLALLAAVFFAPAASANYPFFTWDARTALTFSGPVGLPGVTLPAGTYWFRFPERNRARNVVQVLSHDRKTVYAMLMTIPAQRRSWESHEDEVVFGESRMDAPPRIQIWYPAHHRVGYEFLYPGAVPQAATTAEVPAKPTDWQLNAWRGRAAAPMGR